MDKTQYLISVFERLASESRKMAEYAAYLKNGRASKKEIDDIFATVAKVMDSTSTRLSEKKVAIIAAALSDLRKKEAEEKKTQNAENILESFY